MRLRDPYRASRKLSFVGMALVFATFLFGGIWLVLDLAGRSFTSADDDDLVIEGLSASVSIVRDKYGVAYISGSTEPDVMAGLGYAHAQDRLWQMDMFRRFGRGRLSEILGPRLLGFDAFMRTVGFEEIVERIAGKMTTETRASVEAYCSGVNACIDEIGGYLPFEFDALDYAPEPWTPEDCILVMRLLAWEQNTSLWSDLAIEGIYRRVDSSLAAELHGWYPSNAPTIIPGGQRPDARLEAIRRNEPLVPYTNESTVDQEDAVPGTEEEVNGDADPASTDDISALLESMSPVASADRQWRTIAGLGGSGVGSNAWAISGDRTRKGKPLLANDPHLQHSVPSKWYQAVLIIGNRRVAGVSVPGLPWIVIGRNDDCAWGITNLSADETDFYLERLHPDGSDRVLHDGRYEDLEVRYDTIFAKDTVGTPIEIRSSRHGPLLTDIARIVASYPPPLIDTGITGRFVHTDADTLALALRWLGRETSDELRALQEMNRATSLSEFRKATRHAGIPGMSLVYADQTGTIAYLPVLRAPIRPGTMTDRVNPGWLSRYNWRGVRSVSSMPTLADPAQGFVASANNKLANALPFSVGTLWVDPSRAERLQEYLAEGNQFERIDCVQMQSDVISPHMKLFVEFLVRAFPDSARQGTKVREAINRLRTWDGTTAAESPEAAIVAVWMQQLYERTWKDEMGESLYRHFVLFESRPMLAMRRHLIEDSRWFDDRSTPRREVRDDILRVSLGEALDSLYEHFGSWEIADWSFGAIHTLTFRHPFSVAEELRELVNVGPYPVGGASSTLNNGEWNIGKPYDVELGPSMRQIVDFADTTRFMSSVITSGQSGQPMNDRYEDQSIIWLFNGYIDLHRDPPSQAERLSTVTLLPR